VAASDATPPMVGTAEHAPCPNETPQPPLPTLRARAAQREAPRAKRLPVRRPVQEGRGDGWFEHGSSIIVFAHPDLVLCDNVREGATIRMGEPLMRRHESGLVGWAKAATTPPFRHDAGFAVPTHAVPAAWARWNLHHAQIAHLGRLCPPEPMQVEATISPDSLSKLSTIPVCSGAGRIFATT
jgi:hypothetical protein